MDPKFSELTTPGLPHQTFLRVEPPRTAGEAIINALDDERIDLRARVKALESTVRTPELLAALRPWGSNGIITGNVLDWVAAHDKQIAYNMVRCKLAVDRSLDHPQGFFDEVQIAKADAFACAAHYAVGQLRKHTGEPYIVHPRAVAAIIRTVPGMTTEDVITGLLHDVVEDTGIPLPVIEDVFGPVVRLKVWYMTDPPTIKGGPNRRERKAMTCERFSHADANTQTDKVADIIENHHDIHDHDPDFALIYNREALALLNVMDKADPELSARCRAILTAH